MTSDILWEVLTDSDNLEIFQPNIEASRILVRHPDGQRLHLSTRLRPAYFIPGWILDRLIRQSARKSLDAIRQEAIRRMRSRASSDKSEVS